MVLLGRDGAAKPAPAPAAVPAVVNDFRGSGSAALVPSAGSGSAVVEKVAAGSGSAVVEKVAAGSGSAGSGSGSAAVVKGDGKGGKAGKSGKSDGKSDGKPPKPGGGGVDLLGGRGPVLPPKR